MRSTCHNNTDSAPIERATHLLVFQHGILGSKHDFGRFMEIFRAHFPADELFLHATESNASSFFRTYDGVDHGGQRIADEIQHLAARMPQLQKFSMIGHSLGGLYNRYCIGLLLSRGFFDRYEPMNFITLASPHLGIRRPHRGATNVVFNALMSKILSRTGEQLMLIDKASEETLALSRPSSALSKKVLNPVLNNMEGLLLLDLSTLQTQVENEEAFKLFHCNLSDRKLRVYENVEAQAQRELKLEVDLSSSEVTVLLPRGNSKDDKLNLSSNFDVQIRWSPASISDTEKPIETQVCVLRIPENEIQRDWKWLGALSNAAFGARCMTASVHGANDAMADKSAGSPLLSCLTRGQFLQALQLFKARTLYSSVFFDMQVPYTCAAVRAFNPYRSSVETIRVSPIYPHIVQNSLKTAHKLRDTIPLQVQRLAMEHMKLKHGAVSSPSNEDERVQSGFVTEDSDVSSTGSVCSSQAHPSNFMRKSTSSFKDSDGRKSVIFGRRGGARPTPFSDNDVILDQLPFAFTADAQQDELRGMLLSMQSIGWRRIDVLFGGVMSHEHIIAKRADLKKPLDSGIDVVHHVMDTFLD